MGWVSSMSSEQIIWLAGAACAIVFLLKMMRDRQVALNALIRKSVEEKLGWIRKKAKATRMAQSAARQKAAQEKELKEMLAPNSDSAPPKAAVHPVIGSPVEEVAS